MGLSNEEMYQQFGVCKSKLTVEEFFRIDAVKNTLDATTQTTQTILLKSDGEFSSFQDFITNPFIGIFVSNQYKYKFFGDLLMKRKPTIQAENIGKMNSTVGRRGLFKMYNNTQNFLALHQNIVSFFASYVAYYYCFKYEAPATPIITTAAATTPTTSSTASATTGSTTVPAAAAAATTAPHNDYQTRLDKFIGLISSDTDEQATCSTRFESCFINELNNIRDKKTVLKNAKQDDVLAPLGISALNMKSLVTSEEEMIYWSLVAVSDLSYPSKLYVNVPNRARLGYNTICAPWATFTVDENDYRGSETDHKVFSISALRPATSSSLPAIIMTSASAITDPEPLLSSTLMYSPSENYSNLTLESISTTPAKLENGKLFFNSEAGKYNVLVVRPGFLKTSGKFNANAANFYSKLFLDQNPPQTTITA